MNTNGKNVNRKGKKKIKKVKKKIDMFSRFIQGTFYIITNVKHWKGIKP